MIRFLLGLFPATAIPSLLIKYWKVAIFVLVAALLAGFVWDWKHRGDEILTLNASVATLKHNVEVAKEETQIANAAATDAQAKLLDEQKTTASLQSLIDGVNNEKQKQDGAISGVLGDDLAGLAKLRQPTAH